MHYLLTQQEYDALRTAQDIRIAVMTAELQELCTLAAKHVPVERPWFNGGKGAEPAPWGCILDKQNSPGYCDDCPAKAICPCPHKEFSK